MAATQFGRLDPFHDYNTTYILLLAMAAGSRGTYKKGWGEMERGLTSQGVAARKKGERKRLMLQPLFPSLPPSHHLTLGSLNTYLKLTLVQ